MMVPTPHAAVTCRRCGEKFVDVDIEHWVGEGRTADDFQAMVDTLGRAHLDTCNPRRARAARLRPADRRRRWGWWALKGIPPLIFAASAVTDLLQGDVSGVVLLSAALVCVSLSVEQIYAFRAGYWRGRATSRDRPAIDLHPADRAWRRELFAPEKGPKP